MECTDESLPTVVLPMEEAYENLWEKTQESLKYIFKHHLDDAEWFYKADDDTFAVVENMRHWLSAYDPSEAHYFGFKYKNPQIAQGFMAGGSGYVVTKETIRRFVTTLTSDGHFGTGNDSLCFPGHRGSKEDMFFGKKVYCCIF